MEIDASSAFEMRIVKKFLWLPKTLRFRNVFSETRWLEMAYIAQMWGQVGDYPGVWVDIKWVTKERYEEWASEQKSDTATAQ